MASGFRLLAGQRGRVSPWFIGRRQSTAPALPPPSAPSRRIQEIPARGPRSFLRLLHRQLSDATPGEAPPAVRVAEWTGQRPRPTRRLRGKKRRNGLVRLPSLL